MTISFEGLNEFILVFARVGGMLFFNPVLSRRNVPAMARAGLAFGLSMVLVPNVDTILINGAEGFRLFRVMTGELFTGFAAGIVFSFYYYLIFMAGDLVDNAFGLAMAKTFDPGTNIQSSLSSSMLNFLFLAYFFITGSHLVFIRLVAESYRLVPMGGVVIGERLVSCVITMFVEAFDLAMHLILPFLAASFVLEISMGVLMKLVPQISVFSIHFQVKILVGFALLFLFAAPVSEFVESYVSEALARLQEVFTASAG